MEASLSCGSAITRRGHLQRVKSLAMGGRGGSKRLSTQLSRSSLTSDMSGTVAFAANACTSPSSRTVQRYATDDDYDDVNKNEEHSGKAQHAQEESTLAERVVINVSG